MSDCHVGANANAGVRVSAGEAVGSVSVANCHVYDNGGPGVAFADGGTDITVSHCQVRDNGSDGGAAGVRFGGPTRSATVAGCHLVDGAGSQAPAVAIEDDHESLVVRDNQFRGGAPILAADDLPVARENEGFVTEHAGVASAVGDGETRQFAIDHGLDVAPSVAEVWAESGGAAGDLYVAAADADQVVVAYPNAPAEGVTLRWGYEARLQR